MKQKIAAGMLAMILVLTGIPVKTQAGDYLYLDTGKKVVMEKGQTMRGRDLLEEYGTIFHNSYRPSTKAAPVVTSSKPSVVRVSVRDKLKALKTGKAKLTLKRGKAKTSVTVSVVPKKYSNTESYQAMEKKIAAFHKRFQKTGITAANSKKMITETAKLSKRVNRQAVKIFEGEYQSELDAKTDPAFYTDHMYVKITDGIIPSVWDNDIDYYYIDAMSPFVMRERLISGQINRLNADFGEIKKFLDKWNPFDERNKTAFIEKKITQDGDTLKMTLKDEITNKQMLGSLTLYGDKHSISGWAYQLPIENPAGQTVQCEAMVWSLTDKKFVRHYTGSYQRGTKTIRWEHDRTAYYSSPNNRGKDRLPKGKYVIFYSPSLNEQFYFDLVKEQYKAYVKAEKTNDKAKIKKLYGNWGTLPRKMAHYGFYEFTVK